MSSVLLHFPNARIMKAVLSNHPFLEWNDKEITKAISELAAERFANKDKVERDVKMGTIILINDLQKGEDSLTGKVLPNFGKLPSTFWDNVSIATEKALLDCAEKLYLFPRL